MLPSFTLLDELRYKTIQSARLSPDGTRVVYALKQNDLHQETTTTHLWLIDLTRGDPRQLTFSGKANTSPEWSPDGKTIAFLSDRLGKPQVFLLPTDGGEARQLTRLKQGAGQGPVWSPDGQMVAFTASALEELPDPALPYRLTRAVYRLDGVGNLDYAVQNVYVQSVAGEEAQKLTDHPNLAHALAWSPDGRQLLYLAAADPDRLELFSAAIRTVDLSGRVREVLGLDWGFITGAIWSCDGKTILFAGSEAGKPMGAKMDLWVLDPTTGKIECRTRGMDFGGIYGFGTYLALDDGHVLGSIPRQGMGEIYKIALQGEETWQVVIQGKRDAQLQDVKAGRILFNESTPHNPSELGLASLDGAGERLLTEINTSWLREIRLPEVENLRFKSENGLEVEGWILLPPESRPPYPTVLYIHGGPHGAYGYAFRHDFEFLAGAGYAVLYINPRGSCGYGEAFSTALSGHWGVMDYLDQMAGLDYAIAKGLADPDRLGVCGLSYGGYMTCFIVGQTHRFKAAVAENPITDLVSRYGAADMGPWGSLGELGGKPHEIPEVYRRSSPITYAHRVTTPTLLVQGENDYRCPAGQSEQFYSMLRANGCVVEMLRLPNMPHSGSINGPLPVQKAQNEALLGWMDKYVKGSD